MITIDMKRFYYTVVILLSVIYVLLLFGMIKVHYQELISLNSIDIYKTIEQYNWKYWFEGGNKRLTLFADFLRSVDIHYLHSNGMIPIGINLFFIAATLFVVLRIIYELFDRRHPFLRTTLILISVIFLFSSLQDGSIVWRFDKQLVAAYFFPLFSYYALIRYTQTQREVIFYLAFVSAIIIIFTTPYVFSSLIVFFLLGLSTPINKWKKMLLFVPLFFATILYYQEITPTISSIQEQLRSITTIQSTLHYVLSYLGSPFVYISYEPCFATSAIISGFLMVATYLYVIYLWISKKISEPFYTSILAFWTFYILTAFISLSMEHTYTVIFKNEFMSLSLIAWTLLVIFYVHFFLYNPVFQRRVLVIILTLTSVLYGYQMKTYQEYQQANRKLKAGIVAIQLGVKDSYFLNNLSRMVYIMRYRPEKKTDKEMSIFTISDIKLQVLNEQSHLCNGVQLFRKTEIDATFPPLTTLHTGSKIKGALDEITYIDRDKGIVKLTGWIYNINKQQVPSWLLIVDHNKNVVGYILPGLTRKDVEGIYGSHALQSGFIGYMKVESVPKEIFILDESEQIIVRAEYVH